MLLCAGARLDRAHGPGEGPQSTLRDGQRPGARSRSRLAGEPVEAGAPSAGYRLRRYARKHFAILATAAFATVLVSATAVSASGRPFGQPDRRRKPKDLEADAKAVQGFSREKVLVPLLAHRAGGRHGGDVMLRVGARRGRVEYRHRLRLPTQSRGCHPRHAGNDLRAPG